MASELVAAGLKCTVSDLLASDASVTVAADDLIRAKDAVAALGAILGGR